MQPALPRVLPELLDNGLSHAVAPLVSALYFALLVLDPGEGSGKVSGKGVVHLLENEGYGVRDVLLVANLLELRLVFGC